MNLLRYASFGKLNEKSNPKFRIMVYFGLESACLPIERNVFLLEMIS